MGEARELPAAAPGEPGAPTPEEWAAQVDTDKPVPEGTREITQSPLFDPEIDDEDDEAVPA